MEQRQGTWGAALIVQAADFREPWFRARTVELGETYRLHRKLWEFCVITRAFTGGTALGFGVGREPIGTWIAANGSAVMVTDRPDTTPEWTDTGQHALSLLQTYQEIPGFRDEDYFARATFLPVDMNAIPEGLLQGQFDFTWSCGSFEHLGGIEAGLDFFVNQMRALKPGGVAAHTTEFNIGQVPLSAKDLCLFTTADLERLKARLATQGDSLHYDLIMGDEPADRHIDVPPYGLPHLKLEFTPFQTTSILLRAVRG